MQQVDDDSELLNVMVTDLEHAADLYKPTNYWKVYEKTFLPELRRFGLRDFRSRKGSVLSSFGATDLIPDLARIDVNRTTLFRNAITRHVPGYWRFGSFLNRVLNQAQYNPVVTDIYGCSLDDLRFSAYLVAKLYGQSKKAKPIEELSVSLAGNPADIIEIDGRCYTMRALYYYMRYAYCCQFIDFDKVSVIVELGTGSGKQVEVIRKLHPHISYLIFDIPPQLYVCEQLLKNIFPDSLVSYRFTRAREHPMNLEAGKLYILGTWNFPIIEEIPVDLFWNAVSFQEMEPDVVANYLRSVNRCAGAVFLQEMMQGKNVAAAVGLPGVLRQTKLEHYRAGLSDFELIDLSACPRPLGILEGHQDSFWRHRRIDGSVSQYLCNAEHSGLARQN